MADTTDNATFRIQLAIKQIMKKLLNFFLSSHCDDKAFRNMFRVEVIHLEETAMHLRL